MERPTITVNCSGCQKPIESRTDLVTAFSGFFIRAYHSNCYVQKLKSLETIFIGNFPLNGDAATAVALISLIIGLLVFGNSVSQAYAPYGTVVSVNIAEKVVISLAKSVVFLIPAAIRYYSWRRYEQRLS